MQAYYNGIMMESNLYDNYIIYLLGLYSLSEPNINGTAMRELYIIIISIIMVRRSRKIICRSNLANCKYYLYLCFPDPLSI